MKPKLYAISLPQYITINDAPEFVHNAFGVDTKIGKFVENPEQFLVISASVADTCRSITCCGDTMTTLNGYENCGDSLSSPSGITSSHAVNTTNSSPSTTSIKCKLKGKATSAISHARIRRSRFLYDNTASNHAPSRAIYKSVLLSGWYKRENAGIEDPGKLPVIDSSKYEIIGNYLKPSKLTETEIEINIVDNNVLMERRGVSIRQNTLLLSTEQLNNIAIPYISHKIAGLWPHIKLAPRIDGVYIIPPQSENGKWTLIHAWKNECSADDQRTIKSGLPAAAMKDVDYTSDDIHINHLACLGSLIFDHTESVQVDDIEDADNIIISMLNLPDDSTEELSSPSETVPKLLALNASMPPIAIDAQSADYPTNVAVINPTPKDSSNEMLKMYIANSGASTSLLDTRDDCLSRISEISNDHPLSEILEYDTPAIAIATSAEHYDMADADVAAGSDFKTIASVIARLSYNEVSPTSKGGIQNLRDLSIVSNSGKYRPIPSFILCTIDNIVEGRKVPKITIDVDSTEKSTSSEALTGLPFVVHGRYKNAAGLVSQAQIKGAITKGGGVIVHYTDLIKSFTESEDSPSTHKYTISKAPKSYTPIYTMDDFVCTIRSTGTTAESNAISDAIANYKGFVIVVVSSKSLADAINKYTIKANTEVINKYLAAGQPIFRTLCVRHENIDKELEEPKLPVHLSIDYQHHCIAAMTPDTVIDISNGKIPIENALPTVKAKGINYENYATTVAQYRMLSEDEYNILKEGLSEKGLQYRKDIIAGLRYIFDDK